jgi:hypothetical protein
MIFFNHKKLGCGLGPGFREASIRIRINESGPQDLSFYAFLNAAHVSDLYEKVFYHYTGKGHRFSWNLSRSCCYVRNLCEPGIKDPQCG